MKAISPKEGTNLSIDNSAWINVQKLNQSHQLCDSSKAMYVTKKMTKFKFSSAHDDNALAKWVVLISNSEILNNTQNQSKK